MGSGSECVGIDVNNHGRDMLDNWNYLILGKCICFYVNQISFEVGGNRC